MNPLPKRTLDYLANGASEGNRNAELFNAAQQFRDAGASQFEAEAELIPRAEIDGLKEHEALTAIRSAWAHAPRKPIGTGGRSIRYTYTARESPEPAKPAYTAKRGEYDTTPKPLPDPIPDGTRELLRAAFQSGEGVRIVVGATDEDGHENPKDKGVTLPLDEWLKKLDASNGDPNKFISTSKRNGLYIGMNPLRVGGSKDNDVTSYRHVLVEFDNHALETQWSLIEQSNIPCTAVICSGGKSVHAWVRVDAKDRREYDERVKFIYEHFSEYKLDDKNKNPSRLSRLANCVRGDRRQELLALKIGAASWTDWHAALETDGIGQIVTVDELLAFKPDTDPNNVLGQRWLCRGGSCLFVGQSGIGKSSLSMQLEILWALGRPAFGITPARPLKSMIIQAENDLGDMAEMFGGVSKSIGAEAEDFDILRKNLVFIRDTTHTGEAFCVAVQRLIDKHKPDLVWFDPLLSFIGDDISKIAVCGQFLRGWLNPISSATGVVWMCVHHTGKPPKDPRSRKGWTSTDYSYEGIGSSELTNWARAVCTLQKVDENAFELKLAKRGKRAGATALDGTATTSLWLKHASEGIHWEQTEEPVRECRYKVAKGSKTGQGTEEDGSVLGAYGRPEADFDMKGFMETLQGKSVSKSRLVEMAMGFSGMSKSLIYAKWLNQIKEFLDYDSEFKLFTLKSNISNTEDENN